MLSPGEANKPSCKSRGSPCLYCDLFSFKWIYGNLPRHESCIQQLNVGGASPSEMQHCQGFKLEKMCGLSNYTSGVKMMDSGINNYRN